MPIRSLALALTLLLAFACASGATAPLLKVTFLDVGQGDSILLRFPGGRVVLVDAGDDRGNPAERVILPYLRANGIAAIDTLVLSHAHRDHLGGMPDLVKKFPVREVIDATPGATQMYADFLRLLKEKNIPLRKVAQGDRPAWDGAVDVQVMHPPRAWTTKAEAAAPQEENLNNHSIVLRVRFGDTSLLLAGDAEKEAEVEMIAHYAGADDFRADLFKASHHGSKTSSSPEFLKRVKPADPGAMTAVISVGNPNQFGHPHAQTLKNLTYYAKTTLRTDQHKTIESWSDGRAFRHSFTGMANTLISPPEVVYLSHDAATVRWTTSRPSSSSLAVEGHPVIARNEQVTEHFATVTRLTAATLHAFTVSSAHAKGDTVSAQGTFTTPAAPVPSATLTLPNLQPQGSVVGEPTVIQVQAAGGDTLRFYEKAVSPAHVFATRTPVKTGTLSAEWTPNPDSVGELFVELLRDGKPVAVRRATTDLTRRMVLLDAAHGNFGATDLESMRLDLHFEGFDARTNVYPLNDALLACASVLVIPEIGAANALAPAEIAALRKFTSRGGGLLLTSRADFKGVSNPTGMNAILQALGADLRFNDDQVLDPGACTGAGSPWALAPTEFDRKVVTPEIARILANSSCSILNARLKPAGAGDKLVKITRTSAQAASVDSDAAGDATPVPAGAIVLDAADVLPSGARVAAFGSTHILSPVYNWSGFHQTGAMNRDVVRWLSKPGTLKAGDLAERLAADRDETGETAERTAEGVAGRRGDTRERLLAAFEADDPAEALAQTVATLAALDRSSRAAALPALKPAIDRARHAALGDPALYGRMKRDLETYDRWSSPEAEDR